jgi:tRNA threonylcarbamoyladenosine biosynthesis protein TsaB
MLILGADTSGKNGSIALVRFGARNAHTLESVPLEGGTFSAQLVPQIAALLAQQNLSKTDIDAFAVASGPGSFTGLRVGLAAIKALAETLAKPIAAVSLLEALARAASASGRVISVLDAGRGEVYAGTYDVESGRASLVSAQLLTVAELLSVADGQAVSTSDPRLAEVLRAVCTTVELTPQPRADTIARLGFEKIEAGETVAPEALDATYIRRSDAEIRFPNPRG